MKLTVDNVKIANLLRRYGMSRIPVLAIDEVTIYENTSNFFDEYIAHRIGLIPIKTPARVAKDYEETVRIDEVGPKTIMSEDIRGVEVGVKGIPIVTLKEGEVFSAEGKVRLGKGIEHSKFQSAIIYYEEKDGKVELTIEELYNVPEKDILKRAIQEIKKDLKELIKVLS